MKAIVREGENADPRRFLLSSLRFFFPPTDKSQLFQL